MLIESKSFDSSITEYVAIREYPDDIDHLYSNNETQWRIGISVAMPLQPTYWS
jgi:hypothetical protein